MPAPVPPAVVFRFEASVASLVRLVKLRDEALAIAVWQRRHRLIDHVKMRLSANSGRLYARMLADWVDWLEQLPLDDAPFAPHVIEAFLHWKANAGATATTQQVRIAVIRLCLKILDLATPEIRAHLGRAWRCFRPSPSGPQVSRLPADFIQVLERSTDLRDAKQVQDTALVMLFSSTLLRPRAVLGSRISKVWVIDPLRKECVVERQDGTGVLKIQRSIQSGDPESAPLSHLTMKWLKLWIRASKDHGGALFRLPRGGAMAAEDLPRVFERVSARAEIGRTVNLRALRRLTATSMVSAGVRVEDIQTAFRANRMRIRSWMTQVAAQPKTCDETLRDFHDRTRKRPSAMDKTPQLQLFA